MNIRVKYSTSLQPTNTKDDIHKALSEITELTASRLRVHFKDRHVVPDSNPQAGTIELTQQIPDDDGETRIFHVMIAFHVESIAQDGTITFVPRIFAETVRNKQSAIWIERGPENDLVNFIDEVSQTISRDAQ